MTLSHILEYATTQQSMNSKNFSNKITAILIMYQQHHERTTDKLHTGHIRLKRESLQIVADRFKQS